MSFLNRLNNNLLCIVFVRSYVTKPILSYKIQTNKLTSPFVVVSSLQFRGLRTKTFKDKDEQEKESSSFNDKKDDKNNEFAKQFEKVEAEFRRRMEEYAKQQKVDPKVVDVYTKKIDVKKVAKTVLIVWSVIGLLVSVVIVNLITGGLNSKTEHDAHLNAPHISFDTFVKKFLSTGEVQRIIHFTFRKKAVVLLHENAIIDGRVHDRAVVIELNNLLTDPFKFRDEIRKAEEKLGIQVKNGILVEEFHEKSVFGAIELLIGFAILSWLSFQYGRLARKSFVAWRKKGGKFPGGKSGF